MKPDFEDWGAARIALFRLFSNGILSGYYRQFVDSLRLTGKETVLELGSGTGAASKHLAAALGAGGRLICTDISQPLQNAARRVLRKFANVEFKLGEAQNLRLAGNSVDMVFIHFVLHDIPRPSRRPTVEALFQALKPEGRLVIREPLREQHGMPPAEIEAIMASAGLKAVDGRVETVSLWRPKVYTGYFVK